MQLTDIGKIAKRYLENMDTSLESARLDKYVIMPNHIHCLIRPEHENRSVGTLRTASTTKAIISQIVHGLKAVTSKAFGASMWQRAYHDHIIRNEAEYQKIREYIDENPATWKEDCYFKA